MSRRRWLFLAATLVVLTASVLVCWTRLNRAGSGASIALVFVGYTNETFPAVFRPLTFRHGTSVLSTGTNGMAVMTTARMLVTNNGAVPVQVWSAIQRKSLSAPGFVPSSTMLAQVLKPGESMSFTVGGGNFGSRWWTEVAYQPHRLAERVYERVWHSANPTAQRFMARLVRGPSLIWAESGWITNQTPMVRAFQPINAPLLGPVMRSDVILWPAGPERRFYNITAPPVLAPIDLPPPRPVQSDPLE